MDYKKPILIEIYTEVFFQRDALATDKIFDIVPKIKALKLDVVEMDNTLVVSKEVVKGDTTEQQLEATPRARCWNKEKTQLAQLSKDQLVVNLVGEYPGWEKYLELFNSVIDAVKQSGVELNCRALGLHTLDKFNVPAIDFVASDYLNTSGPMIPAWYKGAVAPFDITLGKGFLEADGYNKQFTVRARNKEEAVEVRTESAFKKSIKPEEKILNVLGQLHAESTDSFESWITDKTRNVVMGGKK